MVIKNSIAGYPTILGTGYPEIEQSNPVSARISD
jgi:hypothetical protein